MAAPSKKRNSKSPESKDIRCEDCFFFQNMLCALTEQRPCPTFRPAHPDGLRPPRQLSFVFRHDREDPSLGFNPVYR